MMIIIRYSDKFPSLFTIFHLLIAKSISRDIQIKLAHGSFKIYVFEYSSKEINYLDRTFKYLVRKLKSTYGMWFAPVS